MKFHHHFIPVKKQENCFATTWEVPNAKLNRSKESHPHQHCWVDYKTEPKNHILINTAEWIIKQLKDLKSILNQYVI